MVKPQEDATAPQKRPSAESQQSSSSTKQPRQQQQQQSQSQAPASSGWFKIPPPLARLFNKFPLLTYPPNELPIRSPKIRNLPTLYVFISDEDALKGLPSYNPSCLKWQAFLKLAGVDFRVASSTNHASPTGGLPFLLPPGSSESPRSPAPIPSNKLEQWGASQNTAKFPDVPSMKLEAYEALLDHRIRPAWLYALYLSPTNAALLSRLYVAPNSGSYAVRATIAHQLRRAAEAEIVKVSSGGGGGNAPRVSPAAVYGGARGAFEALAAVLDGEGDREEAWFFGAPEPGLFDAAVFSYTHLLLDDGDDGLAWEDRVLGEIVRGFPALVRHRERMLRRCWPELVE